MRRIRCVIAFILSAAGLDKEVKEITEDYVDRIIKQKKGDPSVPLFVGKQHEK